MTDHQQAAIEAGAYAIDPIAMDAPQDYPASYETAMTEAGAIIAAAEPHLRKKWALKARTLRGNGAVMSKHSAEWNGGYVTGLKDMITILEGESK